MFVKIWCGKIGCKQLFSQHKTILIIIKRKEYI